MFVTRFAALQSDRQSGIYQNCDQVGRKCDILVGLGTNMCIIAHHAFARMYRARLRNTSRLAHLL